MFVSEWREGDVFYVAIMRDAQSRVRIVGAHASRAAARAQVARYTARAVARALAARSRRAATRRVERACSEIVAALRALHVARAACAHR